MTPKRRRSSTRPPRQKKPPSLTEGHVRFDKFLRENRWTVDAGAEAFGVSRSYISMIRRGRTTPGLAMATRIEKLTGIPCRAWDAAGGVNGATG